MISRDLNIRDASASFSVTFRATQGIDGISLSMFVLNDNDAVVKIEGEPCFANINLDDIIALRDFLNAEIISFESYENIPSV